MVGEVPRLLRPPLPAAQGQRSGAGKAAKWERSRLCPGSPRGPGQAGTPVLPERPAVAAELCPASAPSTGALQQRCRMGEGPVRGKTRGYKNDSLEAQTAPCRGGHEPSPHPARQGAGGGQLGCACGKMERFIILFCFLRCSHLVVVSSVLRY